MDNNSYPEPQVRVGNDPRTVFNMSVGYNLQGIINDNVQWFLDKMSDCEEELTP